jgi:alpha-methylacyl-CoA racemase
MADSEARGPLHGLRIVEVAGQGPGPYGCTVLADLGADVVRVDRPGADAQWPPLDAMIRRSRRSVLLDLKTPGGLRAALALTRWADVLVEGFRPGVMERLGLGPDVVLAGAPRLVYARMTGWGQDGPLATTAGHDIDYIAVAGPLGQIGEAGGPPVPPLNLVGDFGGGGMFLVAGVLAALLERQTSGRGQVIDIAMIDGAAHLLGAISAMPAAAGGPPPRGAKIIDGGAPFYGCFECSDGRYVAVGAIEAPFYAALVQGLGLCDLDTAAQHDRTTWPITRRRIAGAFLGRSRDEWVHHFDGSDACLAPVLDLDEVPDHPHVRYRHGFFEVDGDWQPAPAPRFSRFPPVAPVKCPVPGAHTAEVLAEAGLTAAQIGEVT